MTVLSYQVDLLVSANGGGGQPPIGSAQQWCGGRGLAFAWADVDLTAMIEASPDDGTTWIKVLDVSDALGAIGSKGFASFELPGMLVRATTSSTSGSQNANVKLIALPSE